jgi:hypothetical protein
MTIVHLPQSLSKRQKLDRLYMEASKLERSLRFYKTDERLRAWIEARLADIASAINSL